MAILAYDDVMLREPRLLVPRMQPLGQVRWGYIAPQPTFAYLLRPQDAFRKLTGFRCPENLTKDASAAWYTNCHGVGVGSTDDLATLDNYTTLVTSTGDGAGDFTLLVVAAPSPSAAGNFLAGTRATSPINAAFFRANIYGSGGSSSLESGTISFDTYSPNDYRSIKVTNRVNGGTHCWIGSRIGTIGYLYEDGDLLGTLSLFTRTIANKTNDQFAIGGFPTVATQNTPAPIFFVAGWDLALSDGLIRNIGADPYSLLIPA